MIFLKLHSYIDLIPADPKTYDPVLYPEIMILPLQLIMRRNVTNG